MLSYETPKLTACFVFPFTCKSGISRRSAVSTSVHHLLLLCQQDLPFFSSTTTHAGFFHISSLAKRITYVGKKGSAAAKDNMALDPCFVTAAYGNITISRTVLVSNGPYGRETGHTGGNTVGEQWSNSRNRNI